MSKLENAEIILLTGGARSGKSKMAMTFAKDHSSKIFVATAEPLDEEMTERIKQHKLERDQGWTTIEEPVSLNKVVTENPKGFMVVDCITLWLSNLMMRSYSQSQITAEVDRLCESLQSRGSTTIIVTNEVGMGIVPDHNSGRLFRDFAGYANQRIAKIAHRVIFMVSGIPVSVK